ncbi:MAG: hypothetical protein WC859_07300 [Elusimicrobiota bacterium]
MGGPSLTKTEKAHAVALRDSQLTPNASARRMKRDPKTIRNFLQTDEVNDPEIQMIVAQIKERELSDLFLIGYKARRNLHKRFDESSPTVIESTAVMDRSFQQRQLLEGRPTNILALDLARQIQDAIAESKQRLAWFQEEIERRKEKQSDND